MDTEQSGSDTDRRRRRTFPLRAAIPPADNRETALGVRLFND